MSAHAGEVQMFYREAGDVSAPGRCISEPDIRHHHSEWQCHEIGLRQAMGARRRDVRNQFLMEAVMLCLIGGPAGVVLGVVVAFASGKMAGWPVYVSPVAVVLAFPFAGTVGMFFGYYPARRASRLDPIEALRFD